MLENEARGWHGSFSSAGRNSAEKYHMVLHKDAILAGKTKKKKIYGFFDKDDDIFNSKENDLTDDHIDIFSQPFNTATMREKEKAERNQKKLLCKGDYKKENVNEKFKYHQHHHKDRRIYLEKIKSQAFQPGCTRYNPKMDLIWKKTLTGPSWKLVSGREDNKPNKNLSTSTENEFYLTHQDLKPSENIFINMNKQTERGDSITMKDVRIRSDRPYNSTNNGKSSKRNNQGNINYNYTFSKGNKSKTFYSPSRSPDTELFTINSTYENTNQNAPKRVSTRASLKIGGKRQSTAGPLNTLTGNQSVIGPNNLTPASLAKIKAPDFSKSISREQLNYISRDRSPISPFMTPNYSAIEARPLIMVSYNRPAKTKTRVKYQSYTDNFSYNIDKALNKVNNHIEPKAPNFAIMTSRPTSKLPLPFYMIKKFDRSALYSTTDKTLELNHYSDGKFLTEYSSFYPKKSFNKIINMNLLNNDKFVEENLDMVGELGGGNKLTEFYSKNLDDIKQGEVGTKFDGVTLKTFPKKTVISAKEKEMFNIDFNKEDNIEDNSNINYD